MGIKLIKEGTGIKPGKFKGLKFYEYGLFTRPELEQLTANYMEGKREFIRQQMANSKLWGKMYPQIKVPSISDWEIPELEAKHNTEDEEVVGSFRKSNRNIQIYVRPKGVKKIITETVMEVVEAKKDELKCPDCGFIAKSESGLNVHQKRWCKHGE